MCGCIVDVCVFTFCEFTAKSFKLDNITIIYDYGNNDLVITGNFKYLYRRPNIYSLNAHVNSMYLCVSIRNQYRFTFQRKLCTYPCRTL